MSSRMVHAAVRPGGGVVARAGGGLAFFPVGGDSPFAQALLTALSDTCTGQETPGRVFARQVVALLSQSTPDEVPPFGACAPSERGWAVILHQGVEAVVERSTGTERLSGYDASTWVDRIVDDGFSTLSILPVGEEPGPVDPRFSFHGGVVPGGGITVVAAEGQPLQAEGATPTAAATGAEMADHMAHHEEQQPGQQQWGQQPVQPQPQGWGQQPAQPQPQQWGQQPVQPQPPQPSTAPPEEEESTIIQQTAASQPGAPAEPKPQEPEPEAIPAEPDEPFESVLLTGIGAEARREPLPVLREDTPKEEIEDDDAPLVYGVLSPAGYFNHPDALYCAVTGVSMLHRTHVLVQRPRPPLGVVVADDGSTFTLNANYVVGREPERDPLVEKGEARPLKLTDQERSLSRVHAEIRLIDWDVYVVDRGSANGTYVLPRGAQQWKRLVADTPEKVTPGSRIAFGKRVMTFESHHQINPAAAS